MKLDETKIQFYLSRHLMSKGQKIVIPNVDWSWLYWEADLISITQALYMYEYEIKISKADFQNDFKKRKHRSLRGGHNNNRIPNYFSYVAPIKAVPLCIPDYAGLIEVEQVGKYDHNIRFIQVKKPSQIHKTKQSYEGIISMLRTIMFKYWNLAETLDRYKIQKELRFNSHQENQAASCRQFQ
jgi:glycyl-tRNA synthetase alpha subunit